MAAHTEIQSSVAISAVRSDAVVDAGLAVGHARPLEVRETAVGEEAEAARVAETWVGGAVCVGPVDAAAAAYSWHDGGGQEGSVSSCVAPRV